MYICSILTFITEMQIFLFKMTAVISKSNTQINKSELGNASARVMQFHARWTESLEADVDVVETISVSYLSQRPTNETRISCLVHNFLGVFPVSTQDLLFDKNSQEDRQTKLFYVKCEPSSPLYCNCRNY